MAFISFEIDFSQVAGFGQAMERAPGKLLRSTALAFKRIGRSDIDKLKREQLSGGGGGLHIRSKGLRNAFKSKASTNVQQFDQIKLSEYTGWKAFKIFETGGTIVPRNRRLLTVLTKEGRDGSGKRKWTQKQITSMVRSGELRVIRTPKIVMLVRNVGGRYKSGSRRGQFKSGARNEIVAYLVPSVKIRKMLDFYGNFSRNSAEHERILDEAALEALGLIVIDDGKGVDKK
jgi:hypothetical protein